MSQQFNRKTSRILGSALAMFAAALSLESSAGTFPVDVSSPRFNLYTDPYNGNTVKVGGFSGLYPVPGRPSAFFVITDRGPALDYVDANMTAFKTFVVPEFGPHILTIRLNNNGSASIETVRPLKGRHGDRISGLPTSLPATDVPFDLNLTQLAFGEDSLDAEGITLFGHLTFSSVSSELMVGSYLGPPRRLNQDALWTLRRFDSVDGVI